MERGPAHGGWIEVICGGMFSGKTEELIRRLRRAEIARQSVRIFKPAVDRRYDAVEIVSHNARRIPSVVCSSAEDIDVADDPGVQVVGIDEGQFFDDGLVSRCRRLADEGRRVIIAGLDQDYRGRPFRVMADLMAEAESVTKSLAICVVCGGPAGRSQRLIARDGAILPGGAEAYEARCRRCFRADGQGEAPSLFEDGGS